MGRLLDTIDRWATDNGLDDQVERAAPLCPDQGRRHRRLSPWTSPASGIRTILWATGYRPDYSWLEVPVLDRKGQIVHDGGVVASPGLYVMGLQYLRRRKSALIDGAGDDARDLSDHLVSYLRGQITQEVA